VIGLGIELGCDVSQPIGGGRSALCDPPQLDGGHSHKCNRLFSGAVGGNHGISAAGRLFGLGHLVSRSPLSIKFQRRNRTQIAYSITVFGKKL
jgi:hypothetical protein